MCGTVRCGKSCFNSSGIFLLDHSKISLEKTETGAVYRAVKDNNIESLF